MEPRWVEGGATEGANRRTKRTELKLPTLYDVYVDPADKKSTRARHRL